MRDSKRKSLYDEPRTAETHTPVPLSQMHYFIHPFHFSIPPSLSTLMHRPHRNDEIISASVHYVGFANMATGNPHFINHIQNVAIVNVRNKVFRSQLANATIVMHITANTQMKWYNNDELGEQYVINLFMLVLQHICSRRLERRGNVTPCLRAFLTACFNSEKAWPTIHRSWMRRRTCKPSARRHPFYIYIYLSILSIYWCIWSFAGGRNPMFFITLNNLIKTPEGKNNTIYLK